MAKKSAKAAAAKKKAVKKATGQRAGQKSSAVVLGSAAVKAKAVKAGRAAAKRGVAPPIKLGRPKVTADEELDLLFHDDYQARQVFAFLRVKTVGELEQLRPEEIIDRLIAPTVATVDRIRRRLAEKHRALSGDEAFAAAHLAAIKEAPLA